MDLRDYWRIIRRQWIWSLCTFLFMFGIYYFYGFVWEEQYYRATSQVGLKLPSTSEQIFRETSPIVPPTTYSLTTKIQLLNTETLKKIASQYLVEKRLPEDEERFRAQTANQKVLPKEQDLAFQEVVSAVSRKFGVRPRMHAGREMHFLSDAQTVLPLEKWGQFRSELEAQLEPRLPFLHAEFTEQRSQLVNLTVEYPGRWEPVAIVNALADAAVEVDILKEKDQRDQEMAAVQEHLNDTEDLIVGNKNGMRERGVAEGEKGKNPSLRKRIEDFQRDNGVEEVAKDLSAVRSRIRELEALKGSKEADLLRVDHELQNPSPFPAGPAGDAPRILDLRGSLAELERQRAVLLLDFKEAHPDIKRIDTQIRETKRTLAAEVELEEHRAQDRHLAYQVQLGDKKRLLMDEITKVDMDVARAEARFKDLSDKRWAYEELVRAHNGAAEQREKLKVRLAALELLQSVHENINRRRKEKGEKGGTQTTGTIELAKEARLSDPVQKRSESALGFMVLVAIVVSVGIAYVVDYADTRIRTEQDVRKHLNLPVLAKIEKRERGQKVVLTDLGPRDPFSEIFNTVTTVISSAAKDLGLKVFVVSSTVAEEGKTTITVNLGVALARKGLRVILVDGDLRRPQLHDILGVDNSSGLSTILEGRTEAMRDLGEITGEAGPQAGIGTFLKPTPVDNLRVLPSGPTPNDPVTLLESARMKQLIEELRQMADFVLIDTPPIFHVGDVLTLSPLVDANLFVVGAFEVKQHEVAWAKHLLSNVEANILGVFLNKEVIESKSYYYYYRYYKGYRYRN